MKNCKIYLLIILICTSLSGCLRYVPSRAELDYEAGSGETTMGGKEEFAGFEKRLHQDLKELLSERAKVFGEIDPYSYHIGPGDLLTIEVFGLEELNTEVRVRPSGVVSLTLLDEVQVAGLTEAELQKDLTERLKPFVRKPKVKVFIDGYEAHKVSVIGEVARPGSYALKKDRSLIIDLLSEAGGRTDKASSRLVIIPFQEAVHSGANLSFSKSGVEVDIERLIGGVGKPPLFLPLMAGDTIVVPEAGTFEVDGEVEDPGSYPLPSKMTVLGGIASAGGLTYSADVDQVELIRDIGEGKKAARSFSLQTMALKGGTDFRLRNGDIIRVPSQSGRFVKRQIVEMINGIFNVGVSGR